MMALASAKAIYREFLSDFIGPTKLAAASSAVAALGFPFSNTSLNAMAAGAKPKANSARERQYASSCPQERMIRLEIRERIALNSFSAQPNRRALARCARLVSLRYRPSRSSLRD